MDREIRVNKSGAFISNNCKTLLVKRLHLAFNMSQHVLDIILLNFLLNIEILAK